MHTNSAEAKFFMPLTKSLGKQSSKGTIMNHRGEKKLPNPTKD